MKIGIGNDHAAVDMKFEIVKYLEESGYEVVNFGTDTNDSCDYPVYGENSCTGSGKRRSGQRDPDLRHRRGDFAGCK